MRPVTRRRHAKSPSTVRARRARGGVADKTKGFDAGPAVARDTLHAQVYDAMKQSLMRGRYKPGQKITIRGVAAALGTSATPVREAIRRLAAEGAVEHLRSGTARLPALTRARLDEITEVRVALESLAARYAAGRMTAERIAHLERIQVDLAQARDRNDYETYLQLNELFHFTYYRGSQMPNLVRAIESMWLQSGPYLALLLPGMRGIDLHEAAIEASRRQDPLAAAAAIAEDIRRAARRLATLLDDNGTGETRDRSDEAGTQ